MSLSRPYWFVGASYGGNDDQTARFLKQGIWHNGYKNRYLDDVKSMRVGDKIAIKAAYTRKNKLPFDNRQYTVSVMGIKAIGEITKNHGDGRTVEVAWQQCFNPIREWYFYTSRTILWKVYPEEWEDEALIDFAFHGVDQDLDRFRNAPYWVERFGDKNRSVSTPDPSAETAALSCSTYSAHDIVHEGCFLPLERLQGVLSCLRQKKNIILQGPPGTGKTWLAKKLAFALMGNSDPMRLRSVQFHANLSYEDFIRGWRPSGSDGKLTLVDGPFLEMIYQAQRDPDRVYVLLIEEINRGNPAHILGEMLTLLEADKRYADHALELSYRRFDHERFFIPDNVYVIGTMNIADRSLAIMDLALRRRFAFVTLAPEFGEVWQAWVHQATGLPLTLLAQIAKNMHDVNDLIVNAAHLGAPFCIGHSYFTPAMGQVIDDCAEWYQGIVACEIMPLLAEYWYDDAAQLANLQKKLGQLG